MKKVFISLFIIIILIILIWAPWMTNDWCKSRLINHRFEGVGPVTESWEVSAGWIPFGRNLDVLEPESERPSGAVGGYGFQISMLFTGYTFGFLGR